MRFEVVDIAGENVVIFFSRNTNDKEEAIKRDINSHEESIERATHSVKQLAGKKQAELERVERDIQKRRKSSADLS